MEPNSRPYSNTAYEEFKPTKRPYEDLESNEDWDQQPIASRRSKRQCVQPPHPPQPHYIHPHGYQQHYLANGEPARVPILPPNAYVGDTVFTGNAVWQGDRMVATYSNVKGKKRRRMNADEVYLDEEIIDDRDDEFAKKALLTSLFSSDITHGCKDDVDRLSVFLKKEDKKTGTANPKRPLNVFFLYRHDIAQLVDRFARLHKEPITVGSDLFNTLQIACSAMPVFQEGLYSGNQRTGALTRRWELLKRGDTQSMIAFESLERTYKDLYGAEHNFAEYKFNPNKSARAGSAPPAKRQAKPRTPKRGVQHFAMATTPSSRGNTPLRGRSTTPYLSREHTPYSDMDDGYIVPTATPQLVDSPYLPFPIANPYQPDYGYDMATNQQWDHNVSQLMSSMAPQPEIHASYIHPEHHQGLYEIPMSFAQQPIEGYRFPSSSPSLAAPFTIPGSPHHGSISPSGSEHDGGAKTGEDPGFYEELIGSLSRRGSQVV